MEKGRQIIRDCVKALAIGAAVAAALAAVLFLTGFLAGHGVGAGAEAAKDGVLVASSLLLLVLAGMLLVKGKKPEHFASGNGWKRHFRVIGVKTVIGLAAAAMLAVAAGVDGLMLYL